VTGVSTEVNNGEYKKFKANRLSPADAPVTIEGGPSRDKTPPPPVETDGDGNSDA